MYARLPLAGRLALVLVPVLLASAGCSKGEDANADTGTDPAVNETTDAPAGGANAAVTEKLAAADAFDGTVDKTVAKCPSCDLGMDGSSEHTLAVADYTLQFCSEKCRDGFSEGSDDKILALKIPGG